MHKQLVFHMNPICLRIGIVSTGNEESSALTHVGRVQLKVNPLMTPVCPAKA